MIDRFQSTFFLYFAACALPFIGLIGVEKEPSQINPKSSSMMNSENRTEIPSTVENEHEFPDINPGENQFASDFIKMLSTLGLLTVLLLFVSWFLKRMMRTRIQQLNTSSAIKVIEQRQLSARTSIYLIEMEGKTFALGESSGNICLIGEFPGIATEGKET